MAMNAGSRCGGMTAQINMTPMIDVLLVLLIIFMVVQAGLRKGISAQVPPSAPSFSDPAPDPLVLQVEGGGRYLINRQPVTGDLDAAVARVFAGRPRKVLFVRGAETATYGEVIRAADAARAAGVEVLGLVPRAATAGAS